MIDECVADLKREEGFRNKPYQDHLGTWTFGYGFTSVTEQEANLILIMRVHDIYQDMLRFAWFRELNDARQSVILQMAFQLGKKGLFSFEKMIARLREGDYNGAASEMRNSQWFLQTPNRVLRLVHKMSVGR